MTRWGTRTVMTIAGQDSNGYRGCIYSYQQAWALLALPVGFSVSFNVDAFTSFPMPCRDKTLLRTPRCIAKFFVRTGHLPLCKILMFSWWEREARGSASEELLEGMNQYQGAGWPSTQRLSSRVVLQGMVTLTPPPSTGCSTAGVCRGQLVVMLVQRNLFVSHFKCLVFPSHKKMLPKAGFHCRSAVVPGQQFQLIDSHQPVISRAFLGALHPCDIVLKYLRTEKAVSATFFSGSSSDLIPPYLT